MFFESARKKKKMMMMMKMRMKKDGCNYTWLSSFLCK